MSMKLTINIDPAKILSTHHINSQCWTFAGSEFLRLSDKYTPFQSGQLKGTAQVIASDSGAEILYAQPYAHYQYEGRTMGPNVLFEGIGWRSMAKKGGKYYTGGSLTYNDGGLRGDHWDKRMLDDRKQDWLQSIAAYVGGVVK